MRAETKPAALYHRVVVWLLFLILLLPLAATLLYSLSTSWSATILPDGLTFKWYLALWSDARFLAAFGQSLELGARLEDVGHTIHAHPTLGEAVQEAALRALGQALHI